MHALDVLGDTLQPVDEPARASIDHARPLQQGHLLGGVGQGRSRPLQGPRKAALRVALRLPCRLVQRIGKRRDHAEDGALDRLRQRRARAVRTTPDRQREVGGEQEPGDATASPKAEPSEWLRSSMR